MWTRLLVRHAQLPVYRARHDTRAPPSHIPNSLTCRAQVLKNVSGTINSTASDVQKTVNKVRMPAVCVFVYAMGHSTATATHHRRNPLADADGAAVCVCCAEQAADKSSKAVDSTTKSVNKTAKDVKKTVTKALSGEKEKKDNKHLKEVAAAVPSVVIIITGKSLFWGGQQCHKSDSGSLVLQGLETRFTD